MKPQGYIPNTSTPGVYEKEDVHVGLLLKVSLVIAAVLLLIILFAWAMFKYWDGVIPKRTSEASPQVASFELPPEPLVQAAPLKELRMVREIEDSHLKGYGWSDSSKSTAHIPIDRAMVLWLKIEEPSSPSNNSTNSNASQLRPAPGVNQEQSHAP